jgi:prepilin-type N-terminal cleavage/methylation domain-containing protein
MKRKKGFTLIEVLLTLVLYALFSSSLFFAYRTVADALIAAKESFTITLLLEQKAGELAESSLREKGLIPQKMNGDFQEPFGKYRWEWEVMPAASGLEELRIEVRGPRKTSRLSTYLLPPTSLETATTLP